MQVGGIGSFSGIAHVDWQARGSVTLRLRSFDLQGNARRILTGGSGVLEGAITNSVQASVGHQISRTGNFSAQLAYAKNSSVQTAQKFNALIANATYTRSVSRTIGVFLTYSMQRQTTVGCTGEACGLTGNQVVFGAGLSWNGRPVGIR
jgi:hypothetical protein